MRPNDPALLAEQVLSRRVSPEALEWLARGFAKYDRDDGALPLERCLGLPALRERRRLQRDYHLLQAAAAIGSTGSAGAQAQRLGRELDAFMRSEWLSWRTRDDPPPGASPLRFALFRAAKAMSGARPGDKRLEQLIRLETETARDFQEAAAACAPSTDRTAQPLAE
jgi:hypothetical protein